MLNRAKQCKGGGLTESNAEHLLIALGGAFSAGLAGTDDIVASDLAFSLAQDVPVTEDLRRDGGCVCLGDIAVPVTHLAHDFVQASDWIVPLERAIISSCDAEPPAAIPQVFLGRLRASAREGAYVTVGFGDGLPVSGRVAKATPSHVVVRNSRSVAIPLTRIDYVRFVPGGSTDAL